MEIKIKKIINEAKIPTRGSEEAAGYDLYSSKNNSVTFAPGETIMIGTGVAMEIPKGYAGLIYARSGISIKRGLAPANKVGVIDSDYRGELIVALHNHSNEEQTIEAYERIAQIVITPYLNVNFNEVETLDVTIRGDGGIGSTGTK